MTMTTRRHVVTRPFKLIPLACLLLGIGGTVFCQPQAQAQGPAAPAAVAAPGNASAGEHHHDLDGLIAHLHDTFRITLAQEPQWKEVAKIMRENAETLTALAKARAEHASAATAPEDLKSYAEISEAHARGTQRLIPAFQALYDIMSPEQQKAADAEFHQHFREHHH